MSNTVRHIIIIAVLAVVAYIVYYLVTKVIIPGAAASQGKDPFTHAPPVVWHPSDPIPAGFDPTIRPNLNYGVQPAHPS
jgi:hypothetical protein